MVSLPNKIKITRNMEHQLKLDPHGEMLMQQYRELLPTLEELGKKAYDMLCGALKEKGIYVTAMEHRVKTEKSLAGKLALKGAKYRSIDDVTDLVGMRIITFYTDDVDKVAAIVKRLFDIDWQESVDKRKSHHLDAFGYNSLHYICRMKEGGPRFELQMRTALQHVWSTIEHDIGYKGDVKVPREYLRQFSRLAGMLELVDDEFSRLRTDITDYRRQIQSLVKNGKLDDVQLSADSFNSFLELHPFDKLNKRIAAVNQAEIYPVSMMPFLPVLESFDLETLGDVQRFIEENKDDAYQLALSQLAVTDLDILSASTALLYLCLVHALKHEGSREGLMLVYDTINGKSEANGMLADMMLEQAKMLPFMQSKRKIVPTKEQKIDTTMVDRAILFATNAHKGVVRKGTLLPYIAHPLEALAIVATITSDQDLLAAAVLHDVVEDTSASIEDIRREFGQHVAELVDAETDREVEGMNHVDSWKKRKQATIDRLAHASREVQIVALGDKLSNIRAMSANLRQQGEQVWQRFNVKDRACHAWYYHQLVVSLSGLGETDAYREFAELVEQVFPSH